MTEELLTDASLREFLLGKIAHEQREQIENLFLTDSPAREKILVVEQDLIEDYLEDNLSAPDKELFLARYGQTQAQQRQLLIKKSIKDYALRESASTFARPAKVSTWDWFRERVHPRLGVLIATAVTAMILIIVIAVWLSSRRDQEHRRLAIEQELALLNAPANLGKVPADMSSVRLSPLSVRSAEKENEVTKTPGIQIVQLRLPWIEGERYANYRAEVSSFKGEELITFPPVQGEDNGEYGIRIRLPARLLHRGNYKVRVTGIRADGGAGVTHEYSFAVSE